jgi:hypothetical protein
MMFASREHSLGPPVVALPALDSVVDIGASRLHDGLLARMRARLRPRERSHGERLRFHGLVLDTRTRAVRRGHRAIELTPMEFNLLEFFLRNPRRVLTRRESFVSP